MAVSRFHSPVEEAVRRIVATQPGLIADWREQYMPYLDVRNLTGNESFPLVSCVAIGSNVDAEFTFAVADVTIMVIDTIPENICEQKPGELSMDLVYFAARYNDVLLEIAQWLGNHESRDAFIEQDYHWDSELTFNIAIGDDLFDTRTDAEKSPLRKRLFATMFRGRLKGRLKGICCAVSDEPLQGVSC